MKRLTINDMKQIKGGKNLLGCNGDRCCIRYYFSEVDVTICGNLEWYMYKA